MRGEFNSSHKELVSGYFEALWSFVDEIEDQAVFLLDKNGIVVRCNKGAEKITGFSREEIGRHFSFLYPEEDINHGKPEKELSICKREGEYRTEEVRIRKGGFRFRAGVVVHPMYDSDGLMGYLMVVRDATGEIIKEGMRAERALRVLTKANRAIIHIRDEKELLERICRIIVDEGYAYAWIGYEIDDGSVRPMGKAGKNGYVDVVRITLDESKIGRGSTGRPIRGSVTLPLVFQNAVFGALNVYDSGRDAFDRDEVKILQEVANSLAYAITMLRSDGKKEKIRGAVNSLWKIVTKEMSYNTLLDEILREIIKITGSKYGFFGILNDEKELIIHARYGEVKCDCKRTEGFVLPVEKAVWADVMRSERRVIVNDCRDYPNKKLLCGHVPLTRFLIVPIIKNGVLSLAGVANKNEDYSEEDAEMLEFFMANALTVLEKKRIEETYKTLIENTGTAMFISDSETKVKFANEEAGKTLEMPREEIIGKTWTEFVSKDELGKIMEYYKLCDIDPSLVPRTFETKLVDRKGNVKRFLVNISMVSETGDCIASLIDITQFKKIEEMLKESEERYRSLFEKSRDGIVLTGMDMVVVDCNDAALELSGLTRDEVIGKSFLELDIIDEDDLPLVMEMFYRGMRERVGTLEFKVKVKGGRWIEVSPTLLTKNGEPFATLNIIRDITDRKKTENELRLVLERLKIIHELDMGIIEGKSFKEISQSAIQSVRNLLDCEIAGLFRYDVGKNEIVPECFDSSVSFDEGSLPFESRIPLESMEKGKILNVGNILQLDYLTQTERELLKLGMRSYVYAPLTVRGELIGIIYLSSKKQRAFDEKLQFIREVSDQLAIALQEARLFEMRIKSLKRIEKNIEEFAILVDHIRNPLAIISGTVEVKIPDEEVRRIIRECVEKIEEVVSRLDRGWLESEDVRKFLMTCIQPSTKGS
jgi:PAS domain S-box-containing protein